MATIHHFEDLDIWQKARVLSRDIYAILDNEDFLRDFRLRDQMRASSGSVMDNIAEGFERNGNKEFIQFLFIAKGSCGEVRSQLYRALDSGYISEAKFEMLKQKTAALSHDIGSFIKYLKQSGIKGSKYKT